MSGFFRIYAASQISRCEAKCVGDLQWDLSTQHTLDVTQSRVLCTTYTIQFRKNNNNNNQQYYWLWDVRRWSDFQHWFYEWQEIISTVNIVICNYSSVLCSVSVDCISTIRRSHWTPYITPIYVSRVKWSAEEYIDRIYTSTTHWQNVRRPTGQHWVLSAWVRLEFIRVGLWRCENRCMFMTDIYWHNYVRLRIGSC